MTASAQHVEGQEPKQVPPTPEEVPAMLAVVFEERYGVSCLVDDDTITVENNGGAITFRRCEPPNEVDTIHPDNVHSRTPLDIRVTLRKLCGKCVDGTGITPLLEGARCWASNGRTGLSVGDAFFEVVMVEPERIIPITDYVSPYNPSDLRAASGRG